MAGETPGRMPVRLVLNGQPRTIDAPSDASLLEVLRGACEPCRVPHVDVEARAVCTNNPPCGALHAFDGEWRDRMPTRRSPAARALSVGRKGRA